MTFYRSQTINQRERSGTTRAPVRHPTTMPIAGLRALPATGSGSQRQASRAGCRGGFEVLGAAVRNGAQAPAHGEAASRGTVELVACVVNESVGGLPAVK